MRTLLFDTDLGDDVDDAAALVCALLSPRCKLLAVTTVYGDTVARAQLARKIIRLCKMDIPVFAGSSQPLCGIFSSQGKKPPQCATLTEEERKEPVSCVPAAKAILRLLRENPDTVLVATGPLTNLAHCVQLEPETMRKTEIMLMGGFTHGAVPEGNILADPEAASLVFNCGARITVAPLEATVNCRIPLAGMKRIFHSRNSPIAFLARLMEIWRDGVYADILQSWGKAPAEGFHFSPGMHDPMAMLCALYPECFLGKDAFLCVELRGDFTRGVTVDRRNPFTGESREKNCRLLIPGNEETAARLFLSVLFEEPHG